MIEKVVQQINAHHGTDFRLGDRYAGGQGSAFALVDGAGARFVLKWSPRPEHLPLIEAAVRATDELRSMGYPAPSYVLWGTIPRGCFGVQRTLPGRLPATIDPGTVGQLVVLSDLQAGRGGWLAEAFPARPPWREATVHAVTHGYPEHDYCDLNSLRAHSSAAADLLRVAQTYVENHAHEMGTRYSDIVHYDFSPHNFLLDHQQRVVGVVDWEGVRVGDRLFDLATLLFYLPLDSQQYLRLTRAALERAEPAVLGIYLCHLIVRHLDFSIRHQDPATVEQRLAHALQVVTSVHRLTQ